MTSKFLIPSVVLAGSAVGAGGYLLFSNQGKEHVKTNRPETFRSRYSKSILSEGDNLWDTKFEALKNNETPANQKLLDAKLKHTSDTNAAKKLHKQGCREIYDSPIKESIHLKDFKTYCAKTIKDGITKPETWISQEDTKNTGKWDPKLTALKDHTDQKSGSLDESLATLKNKLSSGSTRSWNESERNELKNWCKTVEGEVFEGEENIKFANAKLYCTSNQ
ncbi:hypothetical protein MHC_03275 [Mycoplasma haemocanis str. Illinois]|uniref:Uncharacterized protein n=1 Tax=Mycoplasma haemocanis (strain Illinois) TaxID=1111676 RepID=H6N793_MYCHN|nr:hypothetical protein [Mycoplasma haemocanis]AEW45515.1 hypothetical protein MHC_03275 [Mycoplasma haemocanis str. Illinois]